MARFTIDPGRLNRQIALEARSAVSDGAGGTLAGFSEVARFFAAVEPAGTVERDDTGFALAGRRFRLVFRFRTDVTLAHRLRLGERVLAIETLEDPDGTGQFLTAYCREDAA